MAALSNYIRQLNIPVNTSVTPDPARTHKRSRVAMKTGHEDCQHDPTRRVGRWSSESSICSMTNSQPVSRSSPVCDEKKQGQRNEKRWENSSGDSSPIKPSRRISAIGNGARPTISSQALISAMGCLRRIS